jgi:hypothetical protein
MQTFRRKNSRTLFRLRNGYKDNVKLDTKETTWGGGEGDVDWIFLPQNLIK